MDLIEIDKLDELGDNGVEDMINLMTLNETVLLWNLKVRYAKEFIYTYTGSILVAVNPYKMFNIYGLDMVKKYEDQVIGSQPPHLFAIGNAAYTQMLKDLHNQVIVISGESGAGKTESTKLIMQYLAAVNKCGNNLVTERILEANPLLEAFGNAKTTRNDNSSRFGKYAELYFRRGTIVGARTSEYLLEKSRIVTQAPDERNYHVFYEMLVGLTKQQKEKYGLESANKYFYLNQGGSCEIASKNDMNDFKHLHAAMEILGFTSLEQDTIYKILACVLHVGNTCFTSILNVHNEGVEISTATEINWVSQLLELSESGLKEAFTMKVTQARQERLLTPLLLEQALDARDAVAKSLYQRLFTWLVERINQIVKDSEPSPKTKTVSIAILDIFGFEDLAVNGFEQLCINYANESLQFHFNKHIFRLEQAEYDRERIAWSHIEFHDNQPTIDLIARKPNGIMHLLDDESNFPKGTDQSFIDKCHSMHGLNLWYDKPRMHLPEFSIKHYAGKVTYNVHNFLDKNKDLLHSNVVDLLIQSNNRMISGMFRNLRDSVVSRTLNKSSGLYVTMKPKTPTVAASFHESLIKLIDTMTRCNPWFVRCIKPNESKAPMLFEEAVVLSQLRYTGMLETIHIRKMGYPVRIRFEVFADRFFVLLRDQINVMGKRTDHRDVCNTVLSQLNAKWQLSWQLGVSKVFLKEALGYYLDEQRNLVTYDAILRIQCKARSFLARKRYLATKRATVVLQAATRRWISRGRFQAMLLGFTKAQAQWRMVVQRKRYLRIQDQVRRYKVENRQRHSTTDGVSSRNRHETGGRHSSSLHDNRQVVQRQPSDRRHSDRHVMGNPADRRHKENASTVPVSSLEIPAKLAYVFNKLEGWQPPHKDTNIENVDENVAPCNQNFTLPDNINAYAFSKYTNVYFKNHSWKAKTEPIISPFLAKQDPADMKESLAIFKLVMRFMNDAHLTGRRELLVAAYIIQSAETSHAMRDEIIAQICNQTWRNPSAVSSARGWLLLACCVCCFGPSHTLAAYLLKYASDHAYDGYKGFCQQKLLQSMRPGHEVPRTYPLCLLEWKAARKRSCMALKTSLPNGEEVMSHVDSWMTGEEFVSHLFQCREIKDGHYGWTLTLVEDNAIYECAGYDYVLDLIAEIEVPAGFPCRMAYFLVTTDKKKETTSVRREQLRESPHDYNMLRVLPLDVPELRQPIPVAPRPALRPENFFDRSQSANNDGLLSTSILNQRRDVDTNNVVDLSHTSMLNTRYVKRIAPVDGRSRAQSNMTCVAGQRRLSSVSSEVNEPYTRIPNGHAGMGNGHAAMMNGGLEGTAREEIARRLRTKPPRSDITSGRSGPSDMDRWLDKVFDPVLDTGVDALGDGRAVERRLRGGGSDPSDEDDDSEESGSGVEVLDGIVDKNMESRDNSDKDSREEEEEEEETEEDEESGNDEKPPPLHTTVISTGFSGHTTSFPVSGGEVTGRGTTIHTSGHLPDGSTITAVSPPPVLTGPISPPPTIYSGPVSPPPPMFAGRVSPVFNGPASPPPVFSGPSSGELVLGSFQMNGPDPMAVNSLWAQQLDQQRTAQQIAAHQIAQQMHAQQLEQQNVALIAQLQMQQLQNQLLEQSVQTVALKQQLSSLQKQQQPMSTERGLSPISVLISPPESPSLQSLSPKRLVIKGEIDDSHPGGVRTLKMAFESRMAVVTPSHFTPFIPPATGTEEVERKPRTGKGVKFDEDVQEIPDMARGDGSDGDMTPPLSPKHLGQSEEEGMDQTDFSSSYHSTGESNKVLPTVVPSSIVPGEKAARAYEKTQKKIHDMIMLHRQLAEAQAPPKPVPRKWKTSPEFNAMPRPQSPQPDVMAEQSGEIQSTQSIYRSTHQPPRQLSPRPSPPPPPPPPLARSGVVDLPVRIDMQQRRRQLEQQLSGVYSKHTDVEEDERSECGRVASPVFPEPPVLPLSPPLSPSASRTDSIRRMQFPALPPSPPPTPPPMSPTMRQREGSQRQAIDQHVLSHSGHALTQEQSQSHAHSRSHSQSVHPLSQTQQMHLSQSHSKSQLPSNHPLLQGPLMPFSQSHQPSPVHHTSHAISEEQTKHVPLDESQLMSETVSTSFLSHDQPPPPPPPPPASTQVTFIPVAPPLPPGSTKPMTHTPPMSQPLSQAISEDQLISQYPPMSHPPITTQDHSLTSQYPAMSQKRMMSRSPPLSPPVSPCAITQDRFRPMSPTPVSPPLSPSASSVIPSSALYATVIPSNRSVVAPSGVGSELGVSRAMSPPPHQPKRLRRIDSSLMCDEDMEDHHNVDESALEDVQTLLHPQTTGPFYAYRRVPWVLHIRKEMFTPTEKLTNLTLLHLIFLQVVRDVLSSACIRISKEDKLRMRTRLDGYQISAVNITDAHPEQVMRIVVDAAKDWPYYFARFYPVNGGLRQPTIQMLAVSHSGVRLLSRQKDLFEDSLDVICHVRYEEIIDTSVPQMSTLQIHIKGQPEYIIVYSNRAPHMKRLIDAFCTETDKSVMYVKAIRSYVTRESTLLSFEVGDVISLSDDCGTPDKGWLYGAANGRVGLFPAEYVVPLARYELDIAKPTAVGQNPQSATHVLSPPVSKHQPMNDAGSDRSAMTPDLLTSSRKYCMLEFAMLHFRHSPLRYEMLRSSDTGSIQGAFHLISSLKAHTIQRLDWRRRGHNTDQWTWKEQVDLVKWTKSPIQASLLKFDSAQLNKLALECFIAIMGYMSDYPLSKGKHPTDCIYTILMACHNHPELRDEVYCQLAKQTTNNRSSKPESEQHGWKILLILTCYFDCSETLRPYLFKYIEETAYDTERAHRVAAAACLANLRQTFRFGGRKNVPSPLELDAIAHGRNTKRQMCILPGGTPAALNMRSSSVVLDAIDQICASLEVQDTLEKEEFTLFYVIDAENRYCSLKPEEYVFDVTTELAKQKKEFYLLFQRTSWVFPLQREANSLYIDMLYSQCLPDYLDGFLLSLPSNSLPVHVKDEIALLAALQMRANHVKELPQQRDVQHLVPKNVQSLADTSLQHWTNLVHERIQEVQYLPAHECRARFLEILSRWQLFGSTFFTLKSVADGRISGECLLAINKSGVHLLHRVSHEVLVFYPYSEIISTRRFRAENDTNYLDLKCGNLMIQKITRIETDQGVDIAALIGQYIHILGTLRNKSPQKKSLET